MPATDIALRKAQLSTGIEAWLNNITVDYTRQLQPHQHLPTLQPQSPCPIVFATTSFPNQNVPPKGHTLSNMCGSGSLAQPLPRMDLHIIYVLRTNCSRGHLPMVAPTVVAPRGASVHCTCGSVIHILCVVSPITCRADKQACSQKKGYMDRRTPNGWSTCIL